MRLPEKSTRRNGAIAIANNACCSNGPPLQLVLAKQRTTAPQKTLLASTRMRLHGRYHTLQGCLCQPARLQCCRIPFPNRVHSGNQKARDLHGGKANMTIDSGFKKRCLQSFLPRSAPERSSDLFC